MGSWETSEIGNIAVITFTRAPRNFMSFEALGELADRLEELKEREDISVIMLTSGLPGYFIAHADLDDLARAGRGEPVKGERTSWRTTPALIEAMPQPVIAAINGQAWGGGTELSLACTFRIVSQSSSFGLPEVAVGQIPAAGSTQRLPPLVGLGRAMEIILSGRKIQSDEALSIGLANAVLPDENFADAALQWAQQIARHHRPALVAGKRAIIDGNRLPFNEGMALEREWALPRTQDPVSLAHREALSKRYAETPADIVVDF